MRIAYFAEIFPSRSETWIHHEIDELEKLGCQVVDIPKLIDWIEY